LTYRIIQQPAFENSPIPNWGLGRGEQVEYVGGGVREEGGVDNMPGL